MRLLSGSYIPAPDLKEARYRMKTVQARASEIQRLQKTLESATPYTDLGADFYASRETPQARQDYLIRQLQKFKPRLRHHRHPSGGCLTA